MRTRLWSSLAAFAAQPLAGQSELLVELSNPDRQATLRL